MNSSNYLSRVLSRSLCSLASLRNLSAFSHLSPTSTSLRPLPYLLLANKL